VLLGVQTHNETGDIHHLLANPAWKNPCLSKINVTTNMGVQSHNKVADIYHLPENSVWKNIPYLLEYKTKLFS
jgi:hypothetical protein